MVPVVGLGRFMLCFLREFSHQTADSQGYSATTRFNPILLVHYSATEEFTETTLAGSTGFVHPLPEVDARQPRSQSVVSMSRFVTRPPFMTRLRRACLRRLALAMTKLVQFTTV